MGKYRIYPTKSNTIIEGSRVNTSNNEVMELWYGNEGKTRYLVRFTFDEYNSEYQAGRVPHISAATATFHMTNCYPVFEREPYASAESPSAAGLEVKVVQQIWDAGAGYDFYGLNVVRDESNWYSASSTNHWALAGGDYLYTVFSGMVETDSLDFSGDVTVEIELWRAFTGANFGFAVKYTSAYESLSGDTKQVLKYFTENAKTRYKMPYIEFSWDNQVKDERNDVSAGTSKRLYLYLTKNGNLTNANSVSAVTVAFSDSGLTGYTAATIQNPMPGVYYTTLPYPTTGGTGVTFTDSWRVRYEAGQPYATVTQTGSTVATDDGWSTYIDSTIGDYVLSIPNMTHEYTQGDRVFLTVNALTKYTSTPNILKSMDYRIDLIDGNMRIPFVDWEGVSYTQDENFIVIDTNWLLTGYTYSLTFRYTVDGNLVHDSSERKFRIEA